MQDLQNRHKQHEYVSTDERLIELCQHWQRQEVIMLDTEFVRSRTLYPMLGLIQVYDGDNLVLIDALTITDKSSLKTLMSSEVIKVIHSCSEDLDALSHYLGSYPQCVFDTQIAASFLGMGNSLGYANLVSQFCEVKLDKTESRTDWLARPLRPEQLDYAAADVTFLSEIFKQVYAQLDEHGLLDTVFQEAQLMVEKKAHPLPANYAYLNYSNNWKLNGKRLYALQILAKWRLECAQKQNLAVNFVLRETSLFEIAFKLPSNLAALSKVNGLYGKQLRKYSDDLLAIVHQVEDADDSDYPAKIMRLIDYSEYKRLSADIKSLVTECAQKHDLPEAVIASKKQINDVIKFAWFEICDTELRELKPDLLFGWREELIADKIRALFSESGGQYNAIRSL